MGKENRTFLRIYTKLRGYARKTDSPDEAPFFRASGLTSEPGTASHRDTGHIPEAFLDIFKDITTKLDLIISSFSQDRILKDFPLSLKIIQISGAGVLFTTTDDIKVGDHLEMVLILSQLPLSMAGVIGTVQRREEKKGNQIFAFNFRHIRESDREAIVKFVFQEQREQIRERKNEY